jgi:hypothetical protein
VATNWVHVKSTDGHTVAIPAKAAGAARSADFEAATLIQIKGAFIPREASK